MKIQVLDHGYVELIEPWGIGRDGRDLYVTREHGEPVINDDCDYEVGIIEAARQSTQGSFRGWEQDQKLINHLYSHNHDTPFEFCGMVIEVQAPIFVFREWHRHRTQSYNEMSARYAPLPDLYYQPATEAVYARAFKAITDPNKQAAAMASPFAPRLKDFEVWTEMLAHAYARAEEVYQWGLAAGVPKELARLVMPVGHYSRMRAAANLRNWLSFMTLRCDSKAQWEIQQFATAVARIVAEKFPRTFKLWSEAHGHSVESKS